MCGFGLLRFRSPLLTECLLVYFPPGTEMFYFPGCAVRPCGRDRLGIKPDGFPHSDISGSKVARHLPEAYRRHATSFIAISSQGIHHTPLNFPLGNLKTAFAFILLLETNLEKHFLFTYIFIFQSTYNTEKTPRQARGKTPNLSG